MKTLDEVIESITTQSGLEIRNVRKPERDRFWVDRDTYNDALHYLKMYRSDQIQWEADRKLWVDKQKQVDEARQKYIDKLKELEIGTLNDPLTWDELKGMEGKPVFVEAESLSVGVSPYWKDWYIIKSFSNDEFMYCNDGFEWAKKMQGRLWQAYRKERK